MKGIDEAPSKNSSFLMNELDRRSAVELLLVGALFPVLAPGLEFHCSSNGQDSTLKNYTFVFFSPTEQELLNSIMEIIIPADAHSDGAREAKVPAFADLMVSTSDALTKNAWRDGLQLLAEAASKSSLELAMASAAAEEQNPQTPLERFFVLLKTMTVRGYYTSWIGIHQDMEYEGNEYRTSAPSCNHPEHH